MKRFFQILPLLICVLSLSACFDSGLVEGSEKTYSGTVVDQAMSVVREGDRKGRAYLSLSCDDGSNVLFWLADRCEGSVKIGDSVTVESAVEKRTDLLVATKITVRE